jgi:hypothetical protein
MLAPISAGSFSSWLEDRNNGFMPISIRHRVIELALTAGSLAHGDQKQGKSDRSDRAENKKRRVVAGMDNHEAGERC